MKFNRPSQWIIYFSGIIAIIAVLFGVYSVYIKPTLGRYCMPAILTTNNIKLIKGSRASSGYMVFKIINPSKSALKVNNIISICLFTQRGRLSCSDYHIRSNISVLEPGAFLILKIGYKINENGATLNITSNWFKDLIIFSRASRSLKYFVTASWIWQTFEGDKIYYEAGIVCKNYIL